MGIHRLAAIVGAWVVGCGSSSSGPRFAANPEAGVQAGLDSGLVQIEAGQQEASVTTGLGSIPTPPCVACFTASSGGAVSLLTLDGGQIDPETIFPCNNAQVTLQQIGCAESAGYTATCRSASTLGFLPASDPGCIADKHTKDAVRKCGNILCP